VLAAKDLGILLLLLLRAGVEGLSNGGHYVITHMFRLALEHVANVAIVVQLPADNTKVIQRLLAVHTAGHVLEVLVEQNLLAIGRDESEIASSH